MPMSHGKREFEGDITTIEARINTGMAESSPESSDFDFLRQIQEDYGIYSLGDKMYGVEIEGINYVGSLAGIFEILRGGNKPAASE